MKKMKKKKVKDTGAPQFKSFSPFDQTGNQNDADKALKKLKDSSLNNPFGRKNG